MVMENSIDSKATIFKHSIGKLRLDPHFGLVESIIEAFKPSSALILGSAPKTIKIMHEKVNKLMAVDFEQSRYDSNISSLAEKAEFYPKCFPVYDDLTITGKEGLEMSNLYARIKNFFKKSDLLVVDQPLDISIGAFNYFSDSHDIVVLRGVDPSSISDSKFNKYRMIMRYGDTSSFLLRNHLPIGYDAMRDIVYKGNESFYKYLKIEPSFRFEKA